MPVAYQKDSSTTKAAAIMQAGDRAESCDGGIAPAKPTKATEALLEANTRSGTGSASPARRA